MDISLQLLLSAPDKTALERIWQRLAELPDNRTLVDGPYEPHITLGLYADVDLGVLLPSLGERASATAPFSVTFAGIGLFRDPEGSLFLVPVVTDELRGVQAGAAEVILGIGGRMLRPEHYSRDRWVPHLSVAWRTSRKNILEGAAILLEEGFPPEASVSGINLVHTPDDASLAVLPLGREAGALACKG